MNLRNLIAAAASGTTLMTIFSHIVSDVEHQDFSEPRLLGRLAHRLVPASNKKTALLAGWGAHYAVGVLFAAPYYYYLKAAHKKPTVVNSLISGAAGGLAGIGMWKATFSAHPAPPHLPYKKFYSQLFVAHLVFGLATAATLHLLEPGSSDKPNPDTDAILPLKQ